MAIRTSGYGPRNLYDRKFHNGVDYSSPTGSPVYVNTPITVTKVGWESGYGNTVRGTDANGNEYILGHLDGVPDGVKPGSTISPGQPIAYTGSTGDSTGPHLHYEVRKNGKSVDPEKINPDTGKPYTDNMSFENNGKGLADSVPSPDKNRKPESSRPPTPAPETAPGVTPPGQPSSRPDSNRRTPKITSFKISINPVLKYDDDPTN